MQDKLEVHCREQLSAMLDGALAPDEAKFLLRRLQHDQDLASCWERWQLCGDLMRGAVPAVLPKDFAQRVSAALAAEHELQQAASAQRIGNGRGWARWAGGATIAASVAVAALFVVQRNLTPAAPRVAAPPLVSAVPATGPSATNDAATARTTSVAVTVAQARTDLARPDLARAPDLPVLAVANDAIANDALVLDEIQGAQISAQRRSTPASDAVRQVEPDRLAAVRPEAGELAARELEAGRPGIEQSGLDRSGVEQSGIDQSGLDQPGLNQPGFDQVRLAQAPAATPAGDPRTTDLGATDAGGAFAADPQTSSRPWPRSSTLGGSGGSFSVGYDGFSAGQSQQPGFELFRPPPHAAAPDAVQSQP